MDEKLGIKELKEGLEGLGILAEFAGKVLKDGKADVADLKHVIDLGLEFPKLEAAAKDIAKAKDELQDLDKAELIELISLVYSGVARFEAAKK